MSPVNNLASLPLTRHVLGDGLWGDHPLFLIDVGASGGIQDHWRVFSGHLRAVGFDPLVAEIERLNGVESDPGVRYEAALVTCRGFDERFPLETRRNRSISKNNDPFQRVSAAHAHRLEQRLRQQSYIQQVFNAGAPVVLTQHTITLDDYLGREGPEQVDFVKIDTDGHDIEVLLGADRLFTEGVLGVSIEAQFHGPIHEHANTFTNIDRFMRSHGFTLFDLEPYRYSRAALPAQFVYDLPAQTRSGQVLWAEATYFRDLGDREYESLWSYTVTPERVLKLACLFELFELPDCAAELLVERGDVLDTAVRDRLLDSLAGGDPGAYVAYLSRFDADYTVWYPGENVSGRSAGDHAADAPDPMPVPATRPANDPGVATARSLSASARSAGVNNDFDGLRQQLAALKQQNAVVRDHLRRAGHVVGADTAESRERR
jgi:FkbM family methyltransferase